MIKFTSLLFSTLSTIRFIKLFSPLLFLLLSVNANSSTLLIVGDSLSAGYQMSVEQSWPVLLPAQLIQQDNLKNKQIEVINASISGDTSANGLARLPALLTQHQPDYVLIELGANDGLRGFAPNIIRDNLVAMINSVKQQNAQPLLMQIRVPTNYGKRYGQAFAELYPRIAEQQNITLLPFFLEHVIIKPEWMMSDGLHPNIKAQPWIAEFMAQELAKVIKD